MVPLALVARGELATVEVMEALGQEGLHNTQEGALEAILGTVEPA